MANLLRLIVLALFMACGSAYAYEYKTAYTDWMGSAAAACNASKGSFFFDPAGWSLAGTDGGRCRFTSATSPEMFLDYAQRGEASALDKWCEEYGTGGKWNDLRTDPVPRGGGGSDSAPKKTCARPGIMPPDFEPGKGCTYNFQAQWGADDGSGSGKYVWQGVGTGTGEGCELTPDHQEGDPDKPDAETPDCPDGKLVTYNGVSVCVPLDKEDPPTEVKETDTKKEPDGSTSTTNKTTTGTTSCNPHTQTCTRVTTQTTKTANTGKPGVVDVTKVTKTTTCGPNGCTTTTTTSKGTEDDTGTPTGTSTTNTATKEGESREGFCKENPELQMCKDSAFSGSCSASFKCDGDAIQCSIAKEQHQRNCKMFDDKSDESEIYQKEKAKDLQRDVTKDLPGNEEIDIAGKLSNADALGGGSCIQDLQVTVSGQSISLPLSRLCSVLAQLGFILVAVSSLAAARIMLK